MACSTGLILTLVLSSLPGCRETGSDSPLPPSAPSTAEARLATAYTEAATIRARHADEVIAARRNTDLTERTYRDAAQHLIDAEGLAQARELQRLRDRQHALTAELAALTPRRQPAPGAAGSSRDTPATAHPPTPDRLLQIRSELEHIRTSIRDLARTPAPGPSAAHLATGRCGAWRVVHVADGNTLVAVQLDRGRSCLPRRIRLLEVEAPSAGPGLGDAARQSLAAAALHRTIWLEFEAVDAPTHDPEGRLLAWAWSAEPGATAHLLNAELVAHGAAAHPAPSRTGRYASLMEAAAAMRRPR